MASKKTRFLLISGGFLLAASLAANACLLHLLVDRYRGELEVRLDPAGEALFAPVLSRERDPDGARRVVLIGDSRVQMWREAPALRGVEYVNLGRGGDTSAQAEIRSRSVPSLHPSAVLIEVGINDLKAVGVMPERRDEIVRTCQANIDRMAASLRSRGLRVLVATVFPIRPYEWHKRPVWSEEIVESIRAVNEHLRALSLDGVEVVDCDPLLLAGGRYLDARYAKDSLHLNEAGYRAIGELMAMKIEGALAAAAGDRAAR